jgi:DNA-binding LytR/AlgR family response regulator
MPADYDFLIVEDELLISEMIADILTSAGHTRIRQVDSVEDAEKEIASKKPDIILTDIALGKAKTGLDLGELLHTKYHIPFIYISSHASPEILGRAKHTRPNAYIVKPFKTDDLLVAIELALFNSNASNTAKEDEELVVKEGRAIVKLAYSGILFFEADGNYTSIVMNNGKKRMVRTPISEFETQLIGKTFIRIHKSYIVNHTYVKEFTASTLNIHDNELPIGRTYQAEVVERLNTR